MIEPDVGAVEHTHQGRFAGARESHDDEDLAFAHIEARILHAHRGARLLENVFLGVAFLEQFESGVGFFTEDLEDVSYR